MTVTAEATRRVEVQPVSARAELAGVVRVGMVILIGVWMYLATDSPAFRGAAPANKDLLPFQALIRDRPAIEQRVFRELQEGLLEAETRRSDRGVWPEVPSLAAEGIPPFAPDPTAKGGQYDWRLTASGTFVNYLGVPRQPGAPTWLVLVQEPGAGAPPDPAGEDEEHHRLITGQMLHVSIWSSGKGAAVNRIIRAPQGEGWTQLYAVGPTLSAPLAGVAR
jgi:hypothetical protein